MTFTRVHPRKAKSGKKQPDQIDITIMLMLRAYPPATMREIGDSIKLSHITVRQRLNWLMEFGYVQVAPNVNPKTGRSRILTAQGFEYLNDKPI